MPKSQHISQAAHVTKKVKFSRKEVKEAKAVKLRKLGGKTETVKKKRKKANIDLENSQNAEDDRTIHTMERLMNIKTSKSNKRKLPASFAEDGLDYVLEAIDHLDEEDFKQGSDLENMQDESESSGSDAEEEISDIEDDLESAEGDESDEMMSNSSDDQEESDVQESVTPDIEEPSPSSLKYIPPANRISDEGEKKKFDKIKRHLKGLINRVSEANLQSICVEIESFYQTNSRALMTQTLSDVILIQFYTPDPIPDRLINESAMVVTVLGHDIGCEVVAYFLEAVVKKLYQLLQLENYGQGKESNNVVQLICSLYQFKIIQKQLILDIIHLFLNSFKERDIELLVLVLKSTGFQLRKDDPVSLKSIVELVTSKSSALEDEQSTRMKFMIEILTAIKNNNVRKVLGYDVELITNRRKKIKAICSKRSDELADVKLEDLVHSDTRGRWWIVGSSWGGAPMLKEERKNEEPKVSSKLVLAAKKLRMNTDVRKKIFHAIMSGQDFVEAFENVMQLGLSGKQQREVCHVLMECCQREKNFNPFYFHLMNKFCHRDRQFIMTLQCSFWDRFKSLSTLSDKQNFNVAKLLSSLLLSEAVPLSCLKTIEFSEIDKPGVLFLRRVLLNIAKDSKSVAEIEKVFGKLDLKKFAIVKNGLRLFIQHFMLKDSGFMKKYGELEDIFRRMDRKLDSQKQSFLNASLF